MSRRYALLALNLGIIAIAAYTVLGNQGDLGHYVVQNAVRCATCIYLALAAAVLISAGQVDISAGAMLNFAGLVAVYVSNVSRGALSLEIVALIVLSIIVASYCVYAELVVRPRSVSSLVLTLGASLVLRGVAELLLVGMQGTEPIYSIVNPGHLDHLEVSPPSERAYEMSMLSSRLLYAFVFLFALLAIGFWRYRTQRGLEHLAVGENELAALRIGVRRRAVLRRAFLMSGVLVFLGWVNEFFAVRGTGWSIDSARGYELEAITAAVIGGTLIAGGRFDPFSVTLAAVFVKLLESITPLSKLPSEVGYLAIGVGLVAAGLLERAGVSSHFKQSVTPVDSVR